MLKLGIVQMSVLEGMVDENCMKIKKLVKKYAEDDIDLLCFPELCISGYDFKKAEQSDQENEFFSELAREYHIAILAGIQVKDKEKYYDVSCIWDCDGKRLGEYRKIHLWDTENDFFEKGERLVTVSFKDWKIGMLICADYGFPEVSTILAQDMGADVIIYPSAWGAGWEDLFSSCAKMRAAENQVYTVALNRACGDVKYCGNTTVANPDGTTLLKLETLEEAYGRVILEKEQLDKARQSIPWRAMKRQDLYSELKRKVDMTER